MQHFIHFVALIKTVIKIQLAVLALSAVIANRTSYGRQTAMLQPRLTERSEVSHYLQVTYGILRGKPLRMTAIVTLNTPCHPELVSGS